MSASSQPAVAAAPRPEGGATEGTEPPARATTFALDGQDLVRSVNRLAIPIIAENLFQTMLGVIDMLMVSRLGAAAIAGVGTALQIMFLVIAALTSITVGTTVLMARFTGSNRPAEASRAAKQSILLAAAIAAVIVVLGHIFSRPVIALLGAAPNVVEAGGSYLDIVAQTSIFLVLQLVCASALRGAGDTRTPMLV
ncbi:MAG: MATE family efflux transporter, partial [Chloroflexi bacterium]|nr:MATE family efflux transporter [Chloroflexota bacterium]